MAQVVIKELNKKYDGVHAVKDVNLTIRDKEFMVLVGPSGCGKTTTLRMVAGLEEITSGEIAIGDRVVNDLPPKDRDIAMVFKNNAIYVTHDQVEAMTLGSRVVVMKDGWVQQVGEPLEIYSNPQNRFVAGFIGSPSMNFIPVTLTDGGGALFAEASGIKIKVPPQKAQSLMPYKGQSVTLGVRPEDLRVGMTSDSSDLSFDAVVEVVEPLGAEILLDTKAAAQQIVARVEPTVKTKPHEKIRLTFIPDRIHFFDSKTEAVIK